MRRWGHTKRQDCPNKGWLPRACGQFVTLSILAARTLYNKGAQSLHCSLAAPGLQAERAARRHGTTNLTQELYPPQMNWISNYHPLNLTLVKLTKEPLHFSLPLFSLLSQWWFVTNLTVQHLPFKEKPLESEPDKLKGPCNKGMVRKPPVPS